MLKNSQKIILSLTALFLILLLGAAGSMNEFFRYLIGIVIPFTSFSIFIIGVVWKIISWANSTVG